MALFEGIGKIGEYAQLRNLRRAMKYRVKTGQSLAEAAGTPVQPAKMKASEAQRTNGKSDANREALIRQKLRQGRKLSAVDMQYLKENNPDLYEKVVRIEERREVLARALKRAKTKDEALRAVAQANLSVLSEIQKGGGSTPNAYGMGTGSAAGAGASAMAAGQDSAEGAGAAVMTAGGGARDVLDAPAAAGDAAQTTGAMQGAIGRDAIAAQGGGTSAAQPSTAQDSAQGDSHAREEREHFQQGPSTRDRYGNRRVLSPEEMADMLRKAEQSDGLSPLDDERVYLLRALQREWMEYANSEEYKNLPNTVLDAAEEEARGVRRKNRTDSEPSPVRPAPSVAEVLAAHRYYHAAHGTEAFEAKG